MQTYTFANITVRPFLKLSDVNNPYIFGDTKHVINMCDYREPEVIDLIHSKGGTFDWFPTEEQPMDVNAILQAVAKLEEYDKDGTPIIVHCMGGNNRSRTVVEAYHFSKFGTHLEDMYKGYLNHLHYNCESGYLPPLKEMERLLSSNLEKILYTRKTQVEVSLRQGEMHLYGSAPKEYVDKMSEIVNRDPECTWYNRELELMTAAIKEVEAQQQNNTK